MTTQVSLLDEAAALRTAQLIAPVRRTDPDEARRLREAVAADLPAADRAARAWTRLGHDLPPTDVRVVSRTGWVRANLLGLRGAFDPLSDRLPRTPTVFGSAALARQVVGTQMGALLGMLSTRVLGQYILPLGGPGQAQLVLIGPNLLELSERYGAHADDVRRTVLLHELAHRLQFDGVPWLGDHLRSLLLRYLDAARFDVGALLKLLERIPEVLRRLREDPSFSVLLDLVLTEEQREVVDEAQGLMSLLEGHSNATMSLGADGYVADPEAIRDALERRRSDLGYRTLMAVSGMDMKRRQYREGEAFVRDVVDVVGTVGLNAAFDRPDNLPSLDEIGDPEAWLARVHPEAVA